MDSVVEVRPGGAVGNAQHGSDLTVGVFQTAQRHDLLLAVRQRRPEWDLRDWSRQRLRPRLAGEPGDEHRQASVDGDVQSIYRG